MDRERLEEILKDFLKKHYERGLTSCVNVFWEDEAINQILAELEKEKPQPKIELLGFPYDSVKVLENKLNQVIEAINQMRGGE